KGGIESELPVGLLCGAPPAAGARDLDNPNLLDVCDKGAAVGDRLGEEGVVGVDEGISVRLVGCCMNEVARRSGGAVEVRLRVGDKRRPEARIGVPKLYALVLVVELAEGLRDQAGDPGVHLPFVALDHVVGLLRKLPTAT